MNRDLQQIRFRYMNEAVGAFVLLGVAVAAVSIAQSSRVQQWFDPGRKLRVILPDQGLFGLQAGSLVQVLGTEAGAVREIAIDRETGKITAEVRVREQYADFIRQDSTVIIRKTFALAGDSYLDISRGSGDPLDWEFAVVEAKTDTAPSDVINTVLTNIEAKVVPTVEHIDEAVVALRDLLKVLADPKEGTQATLTNVATITGKIAEGKGTAGQLVSDDKLIRDIEALATKLRGSLEKVDPVLVKLRENLDGVDPILAKVDGVLADIRKLTEATAQRSDELPKIVERASQSMEELRQLLADVRQTSKELPAIARNIAEASDALPGVTVQAQQTLKRFEQLAEDARQSWLVGGGGGSRSSTPRRIRPQEAQP